MKRFLIALLAGTMVLSMAACGNNAGSSSEAPAASQSSESSADSNPAEPEADADDADAEGVAFSAAMVTDVGGVNDQSFNQSAWEGLEALKADKGAKIAYLESKQEADYNTNLDKLTDEDYDIVWGIGFLMADAMENAAKINPEQMYAIIDNAYENTPPNMINVVFRAQEPSFLMGYIAAYMTETNNVGYVGGIKSPTIDQFEFGFRAGVAYGAKELGKDIEVQYQYAESFSDDAKGKAIATSMYTNGADIVFHAAGNVGIGVIEAAKEMNKYAMGVDRDQNYLAPDHVLSSAMKKVGDAIYDVCGRLMAGEEMGGTTVSLGLAEGACGIAPTSDKLVPADILAKTGEVESAIINGSISVPYSEETFNDFIANLG